MCNTTLSCLSFIKAYFPLSWIFYFSMGQVFHTYQEKGMLWALWCMNITIPMGILCLNLSFFLLSHNIIYRFEVAPLYGTHQSLHIPSSLLLDTIAPSQKDGKEDTSCKQYEYIWLSCSNHVACEDKKIIQWLSWNIASCLTININPFSSKSICICQSIVQTAHQFEVFVWKYFRG